MRTGREVSRDPRHESCWNGRAWYDNNGDLDTEVWERRDPCGGVASMSEVVPEMRILWTDRLTISAASGLSNGKEHKQLSGLAPD